MSTALIRKKSDLTPARQRLLLSMQQLNFGKILNLRLIKGEPRFDRSLLLIEDVKLDGQRGPRPEVQLHDFGLKAQHLELFMQLDRIGTGTIDEIAIRNGLPARLLLTRTVG